VPAGAADLSEISQLAIENDPGLKRAAAVLRAVKQSEPRARGELLPQIGVVATIDETDQDGLRVGLLPSGAIGLRDASNSTDNEFYSIELRQSLLDRSRWLRLGQSKVQGAAETARYEAEFQNLLLEASIRYFEVLAAQDRVEAANANLQAAKKQRDQTENMRSVGLLAGTDVKEALAAYDQAGALVIATERVKSAAMERLRTLTGTPISALAKLDEGLQLVPPDPENSEAWVQRALENNPRILARQKETTVAARDIDIARAERWPVLDLVASRSLIQRDSNNLFDTTDYDQNVIGIQFRMPLFSSGVIRANIHEASAYRDAIQATLEFEQRIVEQETRDAYIGVVSQIANVEALRLSAISAQAALEATENGFQVGTRTTVDVLNAQQTLLDARVRLARGRYDYLLEGLRLQLAIGSLETDSIIKINSYLR
tara:strand:+ start:3106 stop:4398 length:1293 start_codon:yes stop_codon:yes gene_type:complete